MKNIMFVHYGNDWIRGSEVVLLEMLNSSIKQGNKAILWCNSNTLADAASAIGVHVIVDRFVCIGYWTLPKWDIKQYLKSLLKAKSIIREFSIDIVHCNNGAPCQWMSPICKYLKVPLFLHLHARYQQRDRFILLFHLADRIIGVSKAVLALFKQDEFKASKLSVVYNGISAKRVISHQPIDIRSLINAGDNDRVVLFIGSLIPRKGLETLINAIAKVRKSHSIKLAIFGSGEQQDSLSKLIKKLSLQKDIFIFPPVMDVGKLYASNANYFISVPTEEVFGLTLAEASLAGLAIISTNVPGVNEIYTHQRNALLIAPNNVELLSQEITRLINSPKFAEQLAYNAKNHIKKHFSVAKQVIEIGEQYNLLMQANLPSFTLCTVQYFKVLMMSSVKKLSLKLKYFCRKEFTHE